MVSENLIFKYIDDNEPVKRSDILQRFGGMCGECGSKTDKESEITETVIRLLDERAIRADADWNYYTVDSLP